jgi:hypothetical protein
VRIFNEQGKEKLSWSSGPAHSIHVRLAACFAARARHCALSALSALSQPPQRKTRCGWEVYELDIGDLADVCRDPRRLPNRSHDPRPGFEHDAEPLVWTKAGVTFRGSSSWLHNDPAYRPAETYDNEVTIYAGGERRSHLLVPVIPTVSRAQAQA